MSSDESASTQISAISSQNGNEKSLKPHTSEQWEINLVGNFLLSLYHRLLITHQNDWMVKKSEVRLEFNKFLTADLRKKIKEHNGTDNIGTLLHRCGFLNNTPRGSPLYRIRNLTLFDFRNKKLKEQDNFRINKDLNNNVENHSNDNDMLLNLVEKETDIILKETFEVDNDEPKNLLEYQGTTMQQRLPNYYPTNMSCVICQEDFPTMEGFEEHIQKHNDDTDFELLNSMSKFDSSIFTISYRVCKNSHYFCFDIETKTENLVIEKIIIVQSRSLYYVHNARVPYDMPDIGSEQFFVDSHLFTIYLEQPIVLVCHLRDNKETRIIEEHHFMRVAEFPKVNFAINPFRLPDKKTFKPVFTLADYFPPKEIKEALEDDFYNEKLMKVSNEFRDYVRNEKKLQPQTIGPSLNILLQIEDLDTLKQYTKLTQRNIKLRKFGDDYSFKLRPRQRIFIENILTVFDEVVLIDRPDISTNPNDLIQLMLQNKDDIFWKKKTYVGQIEDVNSGRISFKCYQKIDLKRTYTVICRPSRLNIRYQYRSLEMLPITMPFLKKFLFPAELIPRPLSTKNLILYNESINGNPEQLQAVRNIAEGPRNDATYIIFGPPGTGKTTTVVEAILQVLKRPDTKILVTASSNSACDEVGKRLCVKLDELDMKRAIVRIYSRAAENRFDSLDEGLLEHSNMYNGQFYPDIEVLHEYRIVICTLAVVAKLATGKFGRQESGGTLYTHLFIDEVAASMEADALVAITSILTPKSSLIIAGDHKQLGPILQSKRAMELGLGVSLMERLMTRDCYRVNSDTGNYDRTIQTRLRLNFRSHPDIVNLYSGMYYNHDLEAKANIDEVSLVKHWHLARNRDYPILFHCVDAPSYSDNQSQSLYNLQELHVVMDYVKDLMYFGINGKPVKETDIGIISPYKKQYKRIQEELNLRKWFKIETGSVETFQGKEKDIIIVSFVRSGTNTLGFLENPRRLNVTISRAKSLLIMIGNPKTLSLNGDFEYIIKECQRHNTLIGSISKNSSNNQGDIKRQHNKRLTKSTEKLNVNKSKELNNNNITKREQKIDARPQQQKQNSNNIVKSESSSKLLALNNSMQQLNVNNSGDNTNKSNRRRSRGGRRRGSKSKNEQQSSNVRNKDNNKNKIKDENDDKSDVETLDGDDKPSTSKAANKTAAMNRISKSCSQNARDKGNSGRVSKQYSKGKPANKKPDNDNSNQHNSRIESLFNELPQVPQTTTNTRKLPVALITPINQRNFSNNQQNFGSGQQQHFRNVQQPHFENDQQHFGNAQQQYFGNDQQQHFRNAQQQHFGNPQQNFGIPGPLNFAATQEQHHHAQYQQMNLQIGAPNVYGQPNYMQQQHENRSVLINYPQSPLVYQNHMQNNLRISALSSGNNSPKTNSNPKDLNNINSIKASTETKSSNNSSNKETKTSKVAANIRQEKPNSVNKTSKKFEPVSSSNLSKIVGKQIPTAPAATTSTSTNMYPTLGSSNKSLTVTAKINNNLTCSNFSPNSSTAAVTNKQSTVKPSTSSTATANVNPIIRTTSTVTPATVATISNISTNSHSYSIDYLKSLSDTPSGKNSTKLNPNEWKNTYSTHTLKTVNPSTSSSAPVIRSTAVTTTSSITSATSSNIRSTTGSSMSTAPVNRNSTIGFGVASTDHPSTSSSVATNSRPVIRSTVSSPTSTSSNIRSTTNSSMSAAPINRNSTSTGLGASSTVRPTIRSASILTPSNINATRTNVSVPATSYNAPINRPVIYNTTSSNRAPTYLHYIDTAQEVQPSGKKSEESKCVIS